MVGQRSKDVSECGKRLNEADHIYDWSNEYTSCSGYQMRLCCLSITLHVSLELLRNT